MPKQIQPSSRVSAAERKGNTFKGFDAFYLKAKAIIWP
jgi:hypothetical protein